MIFLYWILLSILSVTATLLSYVLAPIAALFLTKEKNLMFLRSWLQPSDNPATGDQSWKDQHPAYSDYRLAASYMWRNPSQGFDQMCAAKVGRNSVYQLSGNINVSDSRGIAGWYLIICNGYFHLSWVLPIPITGMCIEGSWGWRLNNIVEGYDHQTMGQLMATPFRFQKFKH